MSWLKSIVLLITFITSACSPYASVRNVTIESTTAPSVIPVTASVPPAPSSLPDTVRSSSPNPAAQTQAAPTTIYLPTIVTPTKTVRPMGGMVADHTVIDDFDLIPESAIRAASEMSAVFFHQSSGNYIEDLGFECLAGTKDPGVFTDCAAYTPSDGYSHQNWNWLLKEGNPDWKVSDALRKVDVFKQLVPEYANSAEVIGMKFCYIDGWNIHLAFEPYRQAMEAFEAQYPDKIFIWSTTVLWGNPGEACSGNWNSCKSLAEFNQQVREYAKAHNKPLYDIAAIESNGGACQVAGYEGACQENVGGNHPSSQGSIRLAKGYWWLMARLSGWSS